MTKLAEWLLIWCYLAVQFIAVNSSCSNTTKCQCEFIQFSKKYTCLGTLGNNNTRIEILDNDISFGIKCEGFVKLDIEYLSYLDEIETDVNNRYRQLIWEGCPLPDTSFMKLFEILNLKNVTIIRIISVPRIAFQAYHFENLTLIEELYIENSSIQILDNAFEDLQNLRYLSLEYNPIDISAKKIFTNLPHLVDLKLEHNNLTGLQKDIFWYNTELRYLTIKGIFASTLPSQLFANLTLLLKLEMDNNDFTTLPEDLFINCTKLEHLLCSWNKLEHLPEKIFQSITKLFVLNLSYNRLEFLNDTIFHPLEFLHTLNLSGNRIKYINNILFANLKSLEILKLNDNHLQYFEEKMLHNSINLFTLDLNNNDLMTIQNLENFSPFSAVKWIYLRNNSLTKLFFNLNDSSMLAHLDLSFNQFTYFAIEEWPITLVRHHQFLNIDLSNNQITTISSKNVEKSIKTWCLDETCERSEISFSFNNNPIKCDCHVFHLAQYMQQNIISPERINLPKVIFTEVYCYWPESLRNLSLTEVDLNALQCNLNETHPEENKECPRDCNCQYRPVDNTIIVDCMRIGLKKLPEMAPQLNNSAIELLLSDNNLVSLDGLSSLLSVNNVTKLGLSHNKLTDIHQLEIPNTLQVLELDNNQITHMPSTLMQQLNQSTTLISITLHKNPWRCDCQSYDFINFIRFQTETEKLNYSYDVKCESDNQPILLQDDYCSAPISIILICLSLVLFGLLFVTTIVLYFIFEYEIKVWMFAHKIFLRLIHRPETTTDKIYDAFVSVSTLDNAFTINLLISQLENDDDHYNLNIQPSNFMMEDQLSNRINNAVENSSRIVIILSQNYLNNEWTDSDFRMSLLKAINEYHSRVIVILLEDVQDENLDTELKAFSTEKVLKEGETLFCEKLKYELPHPRLDYKSRRSDNTELQTNTYRQLKFS